MIYEFMPQEWFDLQKRLAHNHRKVWGILQTLDYNDAIHFLNKEFETNVTSNHSIKQAAEIWMNAILKKEGTIVLIDGNYSK